MKPVQPERRGGKGDSLTNLTPGLGVQGAISFDLSFTAAPNGTVSLDMAQGTTFPSLEIYSYNSSGQRCQCIDMMCAAEARKESIFDAFLPAIAVRVRKIKKD